MRPTSLALSLAAVVLLALPAAAQDREAVSAVLRARVELVREQGTLPVLGVGLQTGIILAPFYLRRGYRPAWDAPGRIEALLAAIAAAPDDGLLTRDYLQEPLERLAPFATRPGVSASLRADLDLIATEAFIRLWASLTAGKVDPAPLDSTWHIPPTGLPSRPDSILDALVVSDSLARRIRELAPRHPLYLRMREALAHYRAIEAAGGWEPVPVGAPPEPGEPDPRVPALRTRLAATGDLPADDDSTGDSLFTPKLQEALQRFQRRAGLADDGVLGPRTRAALNAPVSDRIDLLRLNLERARWVLPGLGGTYVAVNIAGFESYFVRNDTLAWSAPSIVGQPFRQTPEFRAMMTYLVLNPTWTVPTLLLDEDVLPAVRRDTAYLGAHAMQVLDWQGAPIDPATIDWAWYRGRSFPYRIVQAPGDLNPLGRVKFMFPNPYAVYLHDTPARTLFRKPSRTFSSGCIRIEHPMTLAALLLEGSPWTTAALDTAVAHGTERTIPLPRAVPVVLVYWTAWVDRDGLSQFRPDIYGRDAAVLRALDAPFTFRWNAAN